ncbi:hypothetical protein FJY63_05925 [Candidatus Sumerlaeota bacterium]|nr:hypothetical protein [Candidatus Sumerlaeota bacterium]
MSDSLEREIIGRRPRRSRKLRRIAVSLVGMGLGDRIIFEAPLRVHCRNHPRDYIIAIVDRNTRTEIPQSLRRYFDELWWVSAGDGRRWRSSRMAIARRVRDALIGAGVEELLVPWRRKQFAPSDAYTMKPYNCFQEAECLHEFGIHPRVRVPLSERRWAQQFLRANIPARCQALVSVHVRGVSYGLERNLDAGLVGQVLDALRSQGRFGFVFVGRDDGPPDVSGPDVFSFVGQPWPFERTAAVIRQTHLFVGGESGLIHAAVALGVPAIGIGFVGPHAIPFTTADRYVCFEKGESPQTIMAEVKQFVERLELPLGRERPTWRRSGRRKRVRRR